MAPTRVGRFEKAPAQLGQTPFSLVSTHDVQNVHSNEHIQTSEESGFKSMLQHSQLGRISNMDGSLPIVDTKHQIKPNS